MSAIGFFGPVAAGKTYTAIRTALRWSLRDTKAVITAKQVEQAQKCLAKTKPGRALPSNTEFRAGLKTEDGFAVLKNGIKLDGGPCPRRIASDTPLNDELLKTLGLPEHLFWSSFDELVPVQDVIVVGDEIALRLDARKSLDGPMPKSARSKIFLHRKDDLDYILTFQLPRTLDVIYREFCDLGIWVVEPMTLWGRWFCPDQHRPEKVNPRTGRLQIAGDKPNLLGSVTGFKVSRVDLLDVQKLPRKEWRILDEFDFPWNPTVASSFNTDHKPEITIRRAAPSGAATLRRTILAGGPHQATIVEPFA